MNRFLTLSTSLLIVIAGGGATSAQASIETGNATYIELATYGVTGSGTPTLQLAETIWGTQKDNSIGVVQQQALEMEQRQAEQMKQRVAAIKEANQKEQNATHIEKMIARLKKHVGSTPYVPFGSSPSGWDCSGLVRWAYAQIGEDLYHSASVQKKSGEMVSVKDAKAGDVVAFGWKGYGGAQHSGIYLGEGMMLHAGGRVGHRTEITSVAEWAKGSGNTLITYTRILDN
jgi:cell wall-associated NlpC family hydrolase